jgi:hypothetical protein
MKQLCHLWELLLRSFNKTLYFIVRWDNVIWESCLLTPGGSFILQLAVASEDPCLYSLDEH